MGVDGIVTDGVTRWLEQRVGRIDPPLSFGLVEGGRSNLTYVVTDSSGRRWVLRRPPLHGVLSSAHDMNREYAVITALADSAVPVPTTVGYEPDPSVTGAEFYVMDFVDGAVIRNQEAAAGLDEAMCRRVSDSLVDGLVALHALDPESVGLGDFAKPTGYIERQLDRWRGQLAKVKTRELPVMEEVYERLAADIPPQGPAAIVHGDYRLDNLIVSDSGDIRAVLDWELCTLGDPLADLGMLYVYWSAPEEPTSPLLSTPTALPMFPSRDEVVAWYGERSGRDLSDLGFYVAWARWRIAAILEGVYSRFASGAYGRQSDESWKPFGEVILRLADQALQDTVDSGR